MALSPFTVGLVILLLLVPFIAKYLRARLGFGREKTALKEREYQSFPLVLKKQVTHNTYMFRFGLPHQDMRLGLPVGKHISLSFTDKEEKQVIRPYTPVSSDAERGHFDLVIKIYDQGKMSQHLLKLPEGKTIDVRGPLGQIEYLGNGRFDVKRKYAANPQTYVQKEQKIQNVGMIAGGTGLTPMLQIIRDILKNSPTDSTRISFIFANVTEADIILREELDGLAKRFPKQFAVYYTLDKPGDNWTGGRGFVSAEMIKQNLPPPADDSLILVCGPPPMLAFMQKHFDLLKYSEDQVFKY